MAGLALTQAVPCSFCKTRPLWSLRMRNTLRCPTGRVDHVDQDEHDGCQQLTRSSAASAVADWNERHGTKHG